MANGICKHCEETFRIKRSDGRAMRCPFCLQYNGCYGAKHRYVKKHGPSDVLRVTGFMRSGQDINWLVKEQETGRDKADYRVFLSKGGARYAWKRLDEHGRGYLITHRQVFGKMRMLYLSDDCYLEEV